MNLPDDSQHIAVIGANGSGKTQAALWHLSHRNFDASPWVIYNWKTDASIDGVPYIRPMGLGVIPERPGLYVVHPRPGQDNEVQDQLWAIWERGNIGVYVDEGYMLGQFNDAFRAIMTQGRSKHIPVIILSQRPVWMDKFVFSEPSFYQVFRLQHRDDVKRVEQFVPADLSKRLPPYHSYYYDVHADHLSKLGPVPRLDTIYATFARRLERLKKVV